MTAVLGAAEIEAMFSGPKGYRFARWGRPIAPVVFGVEEEALSVVKGAFEAVCQLAGHEMVELDPEFGSNVMLFFMRDWDEMLAVPDLGDMVPDIESVVGRLQASDASQYRAFRFDQGGAIKVAFVFVRMQGEMADLSGDVLALGQAVQVMLLWGDQAFATRSPLAVAEGVSVLRPEIGDLIQAAYDPVMPPVADDVSHALRLAARLAGK